MNAESGRRNEFVVGMTLAEIFLLLLFVVWWAAHIERGDESSTTPSVENEILKAENAKLRAHVDELKMQVRVKQAKIDELELRLEAVRAMLGAKSGDARSLKEGFDERLKDARRGSPKCQADNVLVRVLLENGVEAVEVLQRFAHDRGEYLPGMRLAGRDIDTFLASVLRSYVSRTPQCRFDYEMSFVSDSDYRRGRDRYEAYFYPSRIAARR